MKSEAIELRGSVLLRIISFLQRTALLYFVLVLTNSTLEDKRLSDVARIVSEKDTGEQKPALRLIVCEALASHEAKTWNIVCQEGKDKKSAPSQYTRGSHTTSPGFAAGSRLRLVTDAASPAPKTARPRTDTAKSAAARLSH